MRKMLVAIAAVFAGVGAAFAFSITSAGEYDFEVKATSSDSESAIFRIEVPAGQEVRIAVKGQSVAFHEDSSSCSVFWNDGAVARSSDGNWREITSRSSGKVTVVAEVDPAGRYITDSRGATYWKADDNAYCRFWGTLTVTYRDLKPDLTVSALTLSPLTESAVDETVELSYAIYNAGYKASTACKGRLLDDGVSLRTFDIPAIPSFGSVSGKFKLTGLAAATHFFRIVADATSAVDESDETNNGRGQSHLIYARTPYTVRFHANGGSGSMSAQSHVCGTPKALTANAFVGPKSFDGESKRFVGWATMPTADSADYADAEVVKNLTFENRGVVDLYAVWADRFYVVYDGNGGYCDSAPVKCEAGTSVTLTSRAPVRDSYAFQGWSLAPSGNVRYACGETVSDLSGPDGSSVVLYAIWSPETVHRLLFNRGDGHYTDLWNLSATGPVGDLPTAYDCWYTDEDGGVSVTAATRLMTNQYVRMLYDRSLPRECTARFYANGGTGTMPDLTVWTGSRFRIPECAFVRSGHHFVGWATSQSSADKGTVAYHPGDWCDGCNENCYAVWEEDYTYTYSFDANGGTGTMPDLVVTNGTLSTLPDCAFRREGWAFCGWNVDKVYDSDSNDTGVRICEPIWKRELSLTDRYRGDVRFMTDVRQTTSFSISPGPAYSDSDLWNVKVSDDGQVLLATPQFSAWSRLYVRPNNTDGDDFLHCYRYRYQRLSAYNSNYGIGADDARDVSGSLTEANYLRNWRSAERKSYTTLASFSIVRNVRDAPDYMKSYDSFARTDRAFMVVDYIFCLPLSHVLPGTAGTKTFDISTTAGWTATAADSWLSIAADPSNAHRARFTYATNESIESRTTTVRTSEGHTITFTQEPGLTPVEIGLMPNGGTLSGTNILHVAAERAVGTLPTPERRGYSFAGWYTSQKGGTRVTAASRLKTDAGLYARWTVKTYTVTFDANGGTSTQSSRKVAFGTAIGTLPGATRAGYAFLGWTCINLVRVDSTTKVAGDVTLKAAWQPTGDSAESVPSWLYRISFLPNGGTGDGISPVYALRGKVVSLPKCTLNWPGRRFAGWRCSNGRRYDDGCLVFNLAQPGGTVTMTAIWE